MKERLEYLKNAGLEPLKTELLGFLEDTEIEVKSKEDFIKKFAEYIEEDEEYGQEPTIMVENPKVWKFDLEILRMRHDPCAGMTEDQLKAYKYGIELFYSWIQQTIDANCKNGWVTVLTPNEDVTPQECTWDEFVKCEYLKEKYD